MENIHNKYRNIIERAIFAGIIPEDSKHIYLSAIQEENDSELSELETLLNADAKKSLKGHSKLKNKNVTSELTDQEKYSTVNKQKETAVFYSDDSNSMLSDVSVENYSILDIKSPKHENDVSEVSSDNSSIKLQSKISESIQNIKTNRLFSKVLKKPMKNQIIDFNVPIYIDVKKKKATIEPHLSKYKHKTQCIIVQDKVSKTCGDNDSSLKTEINEKGRSDSKWPLPQSNISILGKQDSTTNLTHFANIGSENNHIDDTFIDREYPHKEHFVDRNSNLFSSQKYIPEYQKEKPALKSKCLLTESDKAAEYCDSQTCGVVSRRRHKLKKDTIKIEHGHRAKQRHSIHSKVSETLDNGKKPIKDQAYVTSKIEKCKHCKCYCVCKPSNTKVLNETKTTENVDENLVLCDGIPLANNPSEKNCGGLFNVNIICQFNNDDNDDATKDASMKDSQTTNDISKPSSKNTETLGEHISENEKAKKKNKIQRFTSLFVNMKIKRKPN